MVAKAADIPVATVGGFPRTQNYHFLEQGNATVLRSRTNVPNAARRQVDIHACTEESGGQLPIFFLRKASVSFRKRMRVSAKLK